MLQNITLLVNDPTILQGLSNGSLVRYGSVIRHAAGTSNAGQIVKHLAEAPGITNKLISLPLSPLSSGVDIIGHGMTYHKLLGIDKRLIGMQQTISQVTGLTQIAAGASVLNLGVSIAGFAYMGYKLHKIQQKLGVIQQTMEAGFERVEAGLYNLNNNMKEGFTVVLDGINHLDQRLDQLSEQFAYLYLLVQDSREKQESLAKGISHVHQAMLITKIADLQAELDDRSRFPNESPRQALKTASSVRLFLGSEAMKITPELEAELMLNNDIAIKGWAVATATEANLLLEIGKHQDAKQLLSEEVGKFQQVAQRWTSHCLTQDNQYLATAYRYDAPPFKDYITPERIDRISQISSSDRHLNTDQIRRKQNEVKVEFEMTYSKERYNQTWLYQQIALAEYLDTLSELSARLDTLQDFAALCEAKGVKSCKELLPDEKSEAGLYLLPSLDEDE
ncbi:hypothetical protein PCC8801_2229 [Rippkaea orientalis PCC 8801]|uniref:Uncharacterized protein n=1 Tax=Rippkaea orientalis (strain PCC 8801 / RF-1) TaxID=41431 RepID=B7K161_RIPO1|nr:hypothetical protein [Rippkaea orientalis]ACK66256.1 hypothetical protein PCC8801_2229 [Rippkaea orientalis PCC 8801]